jgi:hypothetical protein
MQHRPLAARRNSGSSPPFPQRLRVELRSPTDETYVLTATMTVARLLDQGLQDGQWVRDTAGPGELQLAYYPASLIAAAYANTASLVAAKAEFRERPGAAVYFHLSLVSTSIMG